MRVARDGQMNKVRALIERSKEDMNAKMYCQYDRRCRGGVGESEAPSRKYATASKRSPIAANRRSQIASSSKSKWASILLKDAKSK